MTLRLNGSSSGYTEIDAPAAAGSNTITLPTSNGSAEQFLKNSGTAGTLEFSSMVETSTGVGIGTSSPQTDLHIEDASATCSLSIVAGDTTSNSNIQFGDQNDINVGLISYNHTDDALSMRTSGSGTDLIIDSSGRVLIGPTASNDGPQGLNAALQVEGTGADTSAISITRNSANGSPPYLNFGKSRGTSTGSNTSVANGDTIGAMTFNGSDGSGTFGIFAEIRCQAEDVVGNGDHPGALRFFTTANGSSTSTERMKISNDGSFRVQGVYDNTLASSANVHVDSGGLIRRVTSSAKYKTNIETIEDSYADALLNCRPVWYQSTCEGDNPDYGWWGFIAEEVAEIDPRLVHWKTTNVTHDEDGVAVETPCDPEAEGVLYDRFVPHLVNLVKRQKATITAQQAQIDDLLARVTALEAT